MMPKSGSITEGEYLEFRSMRFFNNMGYFSRRGILLKHYFYPETIDITDIDVYGIKWRADFSNDIIIAQCKSGTSKTQKKTADPILWLNGLDRILPSRKAYLFKVNISSKLKDFANSHDIIPIDNPRLSEIEKQLDLEKWEGSYDIKNHEKIIEYYELIKKYPEKFKEHYWFIKSDYWTLPYNIQIKKLIYYINNILNTLSYDKDEYKWMLIESVILFSVSIINFCYEVSLYNEDKREKYIEIKMIEGRNKIEDMERLMSYTKSIIISKVQEKTGELIKLDDNEFKIGTPEYTNKLIELISRLLSKPKLAILVPSFLDYFLYGVVINQREITSEALCDKFRLNKQELDVLAKLCKNIIVFLDINADRRQAFEKILNF